MALRLNSGISLPHAPSHMVGGVDDLYADHGHKSASRVENMPRYAAVAAVAVTTGVAWLVYTTPAVTTIVTKMIMRTSSNTPSSVSLLKLGIYTIDGSGNLTLVFQSADLHTSFATAASTMYTGTLSLDAAGSALGSYTLVRGTRYAFGFIAVSTGTMPNFVGAAGNQDFYSLTPIMTGQRTGQSDLPTSILVGNVSISSLNPYIAAIV